MSLSSSCKRLAERELARRIKKGATAARSFENLIEVLRQNARHNGYALAVHGSLLRDIDLLAAPWIPRAKAASTMYKSLQGIVKVYFPHMYASKKPTIKPQGRLAWVIHLGNGTYIDLSVMPRKEHA